MEAVSQSGQGPQIYHWTPFRGSQIPDVISPYRRLRSLGAAMRRRDLIRGIVGWTAAWSLPARAQQAERVRRVGGRSRVPAERRVGARVDHPLGEIQRAAQPRLKVALVPRRFRDRAAHRNQGVFFG